MLMAALFVRAPNVNNTTVHQQNVGYLYDRILRSHKKEPTIDTCSVDEHQNNYTKKKEGGTGVHTI